MYDSRKNVFQAIIVIIGFVFLSKLFAIQVISSEYRDAAESNIIMEVIEYPYRGLIHDRNGNQIVVNDPEFDLYVVPKNVKVKDTATFCSLFNINQEEFVDKIKTARE